MTAVWDEVVEYEVIKLGIQCNAMFLLTMYLTYTSHWCKALVLKRCSSSSKKFSLYALCALPGTSYPTSFDIWFRCLVDMFRPFPTIRVI